MCVMSYVATDWNNREGQEWASVFKNLQNPIPLTAPPYTSNIQPNYQHQIDDLRHEMEELKKLLLAAKEYDKNTGQPDCEMEEKVELIKRLAKLCGVDMQDVFE